MRADGRLLCAAQRTAGRTGTIAEGVPGREFGGGHDAARVAVPAANPKSAYKQLFVKGTRIRAEVLYGMMVDGDPPDPTTPEEIAADMNLPVEAVREAIAYCEADPLEA